MEECCREDGSNVFKDKTFNMNLNERINSIIKEKKPCYFVSPHLDDAVFSAGSLISYLAKHTEVFVVSVFSESGPQKTFSIKVFIKQCGFKDAKTLFEARREEDKAVIKNLGAKPIHLGFTDAPWRIKKVGAMRRFFAKTFPEINTIYPTHRWHIAKGKASAEDAEMINKIKDGLNNLILKNNTGGYEVFIPSAIGNHVDHVITRDICKDMFPNAIFWADVPYTIDSSEAVGNISLGKKEIWNGNTAEKENVLRGYKTQFKAMFGEKPVNLAQEIFYINEPVTKKLKVSIGIPAYNEESNIKNLLNSLLQQEEINYELLEILVVSDGSCDRTVDLARSIASEKIKVFNNKERKGAMARQNEILKLFKGDILVLLNADILPKNNYYLENMVSPFLRNSKLGIVSNKGITLPAETFFEKIINFSVAIKFGIFEKYKAGDNIYMCHGHSRALSREFTNQLEWPAVVGEDAYSYLRVHELGFDFYYQPNAEILFRSPQNINDHIKQSSRFTASKKGLAAYFPKEKISESFKIPVIVTIKICVMSFFRHPLLFISYIFVHYLAALDALFKNRAIIKWEQAHTSKVLIKGK